MAENSNANQPATPTPSKHTQKINYQLLSQLVLLVIVVSALAWSVWQNQQTNRHNQQLRDEIAELKKANKHQIETPATPQQPSQNPSTNPQNNQPSQPNHKPQPPVDTPFKPSAIMIDNITAILNTLDTRPIEGYLANEVKLFYASNAPATTLTDKTRVAKSLEYFSDAKTPWDFRLSNEHIARYKKKFDKLFGDGCLTGSSADAGHVVSFCFNKEGKIHSIFFCRDPRVFN